MFDFEKDCKVTITELLKKRFCKDTNLPIKIYSEPYFSHFLQLYDRQFNCIEKYKEFIRTVEFYGSEEKYLEAYNTLKDTVINYFNENEWMTFFARQEDFKKFGLQNVGFPTSSIFKVTNNNGFFVSIDMVKGNFTALHHYDKRIVGDKDSYEDFIRMFTDKKHFVESKYIRQVVFGNVNPRRQVTYEQFLMDKVLSKCFEYGIGRPFVEFFSADEIVLSVPNDMVSYGMINSNFVEKIESVVDWAKSEGINVRCEFFMLRAIEGTDGYMKIYQHNKSGVDFKCLNFLNFPFVLRKFYNEDVQDNDRVFVYEGRLAKLVEDVDVSVEI